MRNGIAEMPDELVLERLRLLVDLDTQRQAGFPEAVLERATAALHLSPSDVGELEARIAAGRTPEGHTTFFPG